MSVLFVKSLIRLMRPKHWIKNFLIFMPLVFSGLFFDRTGFIIVCIGWLSFSLMASAVYILNDISDRKSDKKHEIKCGRPIASGTVSIRTASILFVILAGVAVFLTWLIDPSLISLLLLLAYLLINIGYSKGLKKIPLVDVTLLVAGFLIRVFYGAVLIDQAVSVWLYLTVTAMSLYLGFGKRRNELVNQIDNNMEIKGVLKYYTPEFLDKNMYMSLTLTIVFYALWAAGHSEEYSYLIWTVPLVILICMKYSLSIESQTYADPVDVFTSDKILIALVGIYGLCMMGLLYFL